MGTRVREEESSPSDDAILPSCLGAFLRILMEFHVDPTRVFAPNLPATVRSYLLFACFHAHLSEPFSHRVDIFYFQTEMPDFGSLRSFLPPPDWNTSMKLDALICR